MVDASMKRRPQPAPARKQPTPQELRDACLDFLQRKFYQGHAVDFAKDRPRLLAWVVLWPAKWLNERGVTIPASRYQELFQTVIMDALRLGDTGNITYLPAWLAKVIQSHFACHGDEIYAEAKSMRTLVEHTMLITGQMPHAAPDPVRELAAAAALLKPRKAPKRPSKASVNDQLTLL